MAHRTSPQSAIAVRAAHLVRLPAAWLLHLPDQHPGQHTAISEIGARAAFWLHSAALAFAVALEFSVLLWAPAYLERVVGLQPTSAALGAAAFFLAMLTGRIGGTALVHLVPARSLFFAACATTLVGFAAYWVAGDPIVVLIGLFVVGLGVSLTFPLLLGFAMNAAAPAAGLAATRLMLAPALAIMIGPPLLGSLADSLGLGIAQLMTPVLALLMLGSFLAGEAMRHD
jgi:fucose permease